MIFCMDTKLPKIPDFKPSASTAAPSLGSKPHMSQKAKLSLVTTGLMAVLVMLSFFVGTPIKIAKKAFTPANLKGDDYNREQYQLECTGGKWYVPEADKSACPADGDLVCGELCPSDKQTGISNPEGHICCRTTDVPTPPPPTKTPPLVTLIIEKPTVPPPSIPITVPTVATPKGDTSTGDPCPTPPKVSGVTVSCPACTGSAQ